MVNTKKIQESQLDAKTRRISTSDEKALELVKERQIAMKNARAEYEKVWDWVDRNFKAKPTMKGNGQISPNLKIEEALIEASIWTQDASIPINIEADGKADGTMMNIAKYTMDHFIYKESIVKEIRLRVDYSRARYGTAVVFSGLELKSKFVAKENSGYFNPDGELERVDSLHIRVKDIPIRKAYFDDSAKRYEDAIDCIYEEDISLDEYKLRYLEIDGKSRKGFKNADTVGVSRTPEDWKPNVEYVKIWHYFNKLYAKYIIVVNEEVVIYNGIASTKHGELPLVPIQYYCSDGIYGIGIPERYAVIKGLNQNFLSAMLGGAWINSGTALILWEGQAIDGEFYIEPGEVSIIEMTKGSARDITPYNSNINVQQLVQIIQLMDDMGTILTGINIKAPYTSPWKTAFETSVMKEEQNNRLKTVYETRVHGLEQVFSIMLSNIFTFLPYQYAEQMVDEQQKIRNYNWYQIPLKDKRVIRDEEDKIIGFEEEKGYEDYFDLSPKLSEWARGMKVRITTPATASTMKALEVENISKYIQARQMVANLKAQALQMGEDTSHWQAIEERLDVLFNIDRNTIDIKSSEQNLRDQTAEITKVLDSFSIWDEWDETLPPMDMQETPELGLSTSWPQGVGTEPPQQPPIPQTI